jgi:hypothetical protein
MTLKVVVQTLRTAHGIPDEARLPRPGDLERRKSLCWNSLTRAINAEVGGCLVRCRIADFFYFFFIVLRKQKVFAAGGRRLVVDLKSGFGVEDILNKALELAQAVLSFGGDPLSAVSPAPCGAKDRFFSERSRYSCCIKSRHR